MGEGKEDEGEYKGIFMRYIMTLHTGARIALGELEDPSSGMKKDIREAREIINILGMIQKKTEGNLENEEKRFLDDVVSRLRMSYVKAIEGGSS